MRNATGKSKNNRKRKPNVIHALENIFTEQAVKLGYDIQKSGNSKARNSRKVKKQVLPPGYAYLDPLDLDASKEGYAKRYIRDNKNLSKTDHPKSFIAGWNTCMEDYGMLEPEQIYKELHIYIRGVEMMNPENKEVFIHRSAFSGKKGPILMSSFISYANFSGKNVTIVHHINDKRLRKGLKAA